MSHLYLEKCRAGAIQVSTLKTGRRWSRLGSLRVGLRDGGPGSGCIVCDDWSACRCDCKDADNSVVLNACVLVAIVRDVGMRLRSAANQEAIANVTRTRDAMQCNAMRRVMEQCEVGREQDSRCPRVARAANDVRARKGVEARPGRAGGRRSVSDAVGCEGGLRCQSHRASECRRAEARLAIGEGYARWMRAGRGWWRPDAAAVQCSREWMSKRGRGSGRERVSKWEWAGRGRQTDK